MSIQTNGIVSYYDNHQNEPPVVHQRQYVIPRPIGVFFRHIPSLKGLHWVHSLIRHFQDPLDLPGYKKDDGVGEIEQDEWTREGIVESEKRKR